MMKSSWSLLRLLTIISLVVLVQVMEVTAPVDALDEAPIATIRAVRFHVEPGQTRVWFETTGAVLYTHYSPDPLTLVIDLPGVDISSLSERTVVGSREVESILARSLQSGVNGRTLSRIEIKLAVIAPYQMTGSEHALNIVFDGGQPPDFPESSSPETLVSEARVEKASATENQSNATVVELGPMTEPPDPMKEPTEEIEAPVAAEIREELIAPSRLSMPSHPASEISSISHEILGDVLKVHVSADGRLNYTSFLLESPTRLVFDFNGVLNAVPRAILNIEELGVARVRVAQFRIAEPRITRVVFDLDEAIAHRAVEGRSGLEIDFATSEDAFAVPAFVSREEADSVDGQLLNEPPLGPSNPDTGELSGPSELGTAVEIRAVPDQIVADGCSSSLIEAVVRGPGGKRTSGVEVLFDITRAGAGFLDLGNLAPVNGPRLSFGGVESGPVSSVTDGDGVARARYWAPFRTEQENDTTVIITGRPSGTNFNTVVVRTASIFLRAANRPSFPCSGVCAFIWEPEKLTYDVGEGIACTATQIVGDISITGCAGNEIARYEWIFNEGSTKAGCDIVHAFSPVTSTRLS